MAASASGPLRAIAAGELERGVDRAARLGQAVDDAERVGALGVDRVAGERELHGQAVGHPARQAQQRAGGGDERALDLGDAEPGAPRGDDEVAGQRDLEAAGDREALDRRDERLARRALDDAGEPAAPRHRATRPRRRP